MDITPKRPPARDRNTTGNWAEAYSREDIPLEQVLAIAGFTGHNIEKLRPKNMTPALEAAMALAVVNGWQVFPARMQDGKKWSFLSAKYAPESKNWGMTNDPQLLLRNFTGKWRLLCGVGVPTGALNGIFVIEADTLKGHDVDGISNLKKLEATHGKLPDTLMSKSPSGSVHRYFKHPGRRLKIGDPKGGEDKKIAPGVDVKGDGGMVIAPPSVAPKTMRCPGPYVWLNNLPIADAPEWLLDLVCEGGSSSERAKSNGKKNPFEKDWVSESVEENQTPTQRLNSLALANLNKWVPEIFPKAKPYHGGFRVSSADLKRENEEDLSLVPEGIKDFGEHDLGDPLEGKRTPIQLIMEHVFEVPVEEIAARTNTTEFEAASEWLRQRVGGDEEKDDGEEKEPPVKARPYAFPDERTLERYDWLLGRHLLRGEVAGTVAPGGTGKSSDSIVEALAMASGRQLTHDTVPLRPLVVVLINLEDKRNTMDKRIMAAMKHHKLKKEDIGDRLYVLAKGEIKIKVAEQLYVGNIKRSEALIKGLTKIMVAWKADVLSIDSFIRTHGVNENDNSAIQEVVECFEEIAEKANCGVHLWHHTRKDKGDGGGASVEAARGAKAFIDACRSVRVFEGMSEKQANDLGLEKHRQYFRVFSGKRNFAPHIEDSHWYHIESVQLNNGPPNYSFDGDNIGVVERWTMPEVADLTPEEVTNIMRAVEGAQWRENIRATMWVGKAIAQVLGLDPELQREQIKTLIQRLLLGRVLKTVPGQSSDRKGVMYVEVGEGLPAGKGKPNVFSPAKRGR
jgi:hypothetical protein